MFINNIDINMTAILLPVYMWIFDITIFKDNMTGLEVLAGYYTICSNVAS